MKYKASLIMALAAFNPVTMTIWADQITSGFTYAVASSNEDNSVGDHFHLSPGNQFGKAEVGALGNEEIRGLSEYNLAGLLAGPAFVTFQVFKEGGLFGNNDFIFNGTIDVYAYQGNNAENIADYQATPASLVGAFSTSALTVGDTISLNIDSHYNGALTDNWDSLGIRLQAAGGRPSNGGAWTFDNFRLISTDDSTNPNRVPEGGRMVAVLFGLSLAGLVGIRRFAIPS